MTQSDKRFRYGSMEELDMLILKKYNEKQELKEKRLKNNTNRERGGSRMGKDEKLLAKEINLLRTAKNCRKRTENRKNVNKVGDN
jgi:hypothetical protein